MTPGGSRITAKSGPLKPRAPKRGAFLSPSARDLTQDVSDRKIWGKSNVWRNPEKETRKPAFSRTVRRRFLWARSGAARANLHSND